MLTKKPILTFVCYYSDMTPKASQNFFNTLPLHTEQKRRIKEEYPSYLELVFASARLNHPNCRCVFLTDQQTNLSVSPYIETIRIESTCTYLIYNRLEAQIQFLQEESEPSHYVFLDWDILIQKPLHTVFNRRFDLGFTYGEWEYMPINGGVYFVHSMGRKKAITFLKEVKEYWEIHYPSYKTWWGDQLAIFLRIGHTLFFSRVYDYINSNGTQILLLPNTLYNYTDETSKVTMDKEYPYPRILHFRGDRKLSLSAYWEKLVANSDLVEHE